MIRISMILALFVLIYFRFKSPSICSDYAPIHFSTSGYDSLFQEGFLIINIHDCTRDEVDFLERTINEQDPVTLIRSKRELLHESIIYCDDLASKVKSVSLKKLLSNIDFSYFKELRFNDFYINYFDGGYRAVPIFSCRDTFDIAYANGRIVVFDDMGKSNGVSVVQVFLFLMVIVLFVLMADFNLLYQQAPGMVFVLIGCEVMFWFLFVKRKFRAETTGASTV